MDPLAYRLTHTDDGRARRVLEKVAEMSGWGKKPSAGRAPKRSTIQRGCSRRRNG
jgi:hypothetical protein